MKQKIARQKVITQYDKRNSQIQWVWITWITNNILIRILFTDGFTTFKPFCKMLSELGGQVKNILSLLSDCD